MGASPEEQRKLAPAALEFIKTYRLRHPEMPDEDIDLFNRLEAAALAAMKGPEPDEK